MLQRRVLRVSIVALTVLALAGSGAVVQADPASPSSAADSLSSDSADIITRVNNQGDEYQSGQVVSAPDEFSAGQPVTVEFEINALIDSADNNIVYGAIGSGDGELYGIQEMSSLGSGTIELTTTIPDTATSDIYWTWVPATTDDQARERASRSLQYKTGSNVPGDGGFQNDGQIASQIGTLGTESTLSLAGTVQQSAAPGETARVSYTISNVSDQSSVAINITELPDPVSVNTSASATNDGTFEANGQQVLVSQPAGEQTLTIAYDIDASASADATLDIEAAALNENDTATDTVTTTVTVEQQNPSGAARPDVTAVSQPSDSVSANSSFEIDYRITNPDEAPTAFTFTVPTTSANLSVTGFAGEIQGPNPDGTPPSTSTTAVDPGQAASVTVTYRVAANATGTGNITVEASSAFLNGTGAATTTVELGEPAVPTTPRGRALQVAGVEDPAAIGQRDITVAITLRDRGQPTNGVNVSQRDITTLITLRDRARESQPSRRGY